MAQTDDNVNLFDEDAEQEESTSYQPNKEERKIRRRIWDRYRAMADNQWRKDAEEDWDMADKMFRQWMPERDPDDWRADIVLPDGFSAIQAQMQETLDRTSRPVLQRVEDSDQALEEFANSIMNHNMDRTNFDMEYFKTKYAAAIRGTAFMMDYYRVDKRKIQDVDSVDENGKLTYKEKEILDFDDDFSEHIDNEFIFVDPVKHIDYAKDMVQREIIHIEEFQRKYGFKEDYIAENIDLVQSGGDTGQKQFFRMPEDMDEDDVEVLHYYNRSLDRYDVLANNVVIRKGPIPFKHKELPVAVVYHYMVPGQMWGMGIPKIIWALTEERRSLRNLNLDRQKLQINKTFISNDTVDLDEDELFARPHGLISVNTNGQPLSNVIMPLEYGDVPASVFKVEETLLDDIRRAHGIDDRIQGVNQGGTATEAAIMKESSLKRVNLIASIAERDALTRLGKLKWSNIQFFYPAPRVERITEENEERTKKTYKTIRTNGKEFEIVKDQMGKTSLKFNEINGDSSFKLDKSMARFMQGDFDVTISSESHQIASKAIQQAKATEMFTLLLTNPMMSSQLDPKKAVYRYLDINDENPKNWMKNAGKDVNEMRMLAEAENQVMAAGQPLSATENADEEHTLVHLMFTKQKEFQDLPDSVQGIFMDHILAEHDANPATGSAADMLPGAQGGSAGAGDAPMPNGAPDSGQGQMQNADMQANNPTGAAEPAMA